MDIVIRIDYSVHGNKSYQQGSFPLRGKKPEDIAYKWWQQIKKEHSYFAELEKVIINMDQDITYKINEIDKASLV
jgi:hypothetical protein